MKFIKLFIILSIISFITPSCRKGSIWGIYGKGPKVTQTHNLNNFSSISVEDDADVYFIQDSVYRVEVTGQQNILAVLDLKVVDGQLKIAFLREVRRHDGLSVNIHAPFLNSLTINGSGNYTMEGNVHTDNMGLYINGSGNMVFDNLNCTNIDTKITGSGNLTINGGNCNSATYNLLGSGNVFTTALASKNTTAKISGSGSISCWTNDNLSVSISGSGDVRYKGTPAITSSISGSGKLIHIN